MEQSRRFAGTSTVLEGDSPDIPGANVVPGPRLLAKATAGPIDTAAPVELGRVVDIVDGDPLVAIDRLGGPPLRARRLSGVTDLEPSDEVLVSIVGDAQIVVVLGRLSNSSAPSRDVRINGRQVSIAADMELVLSCGTATVTIARDGRVTVKGDRVTTQARSTNRIRGGSVEIN